jgi:hypothetical protein
MSALEAVGWVIVEHIHVGQTAPLRDLLYRQLAEGLRVTMTRNRRQKSAE